MDRAGLPCSDDARAAGLSAALRALGASAPWACADAAGVRCDPAAAGIDADWVDETGSTNADLMALSFGPSPARPRVRVADRQTAGRGRRGREWTSVPGMALTLSVSIERPVRPPAADGVGGPGSWAPLPIAIGVALAGRLGALGASIRLKWPNDLLVAEGKAGGVLVELRRQAGAGTERVVVGIGLNLRDAPELAGLGQPAASLFGSGPAPDPVVVAAAVTAAVLEAVAGLETRGLAGFEARWRALDALAGREVLVLETGGERWHGRAAGLDPTGALRVDTGAGPRTVLAADVSVRPLPQSSGEHGTIRGGVR